ncbi:MAG TPA: cell wall hydrolase [Desulfotomaculum sp.]|jgi:LysM repeat protein|nr:cell wall hydrolase [Desulfotomaculum sp.]HCJ79826.1 cell wall hydrolase [Desulfotomaculum sp.]
MVLFFSSRRLVATVLLSLIFAFPLRLAAATHTVSVGESLYLIAQSYRCPLETLKAANGLSDDLIYPGKKLIIPEKDKITKNKITYYVQPNDNLYTIGLRYSVSYQSILKANDHASTTIYPGQILNIPIGENTFLPLASRGLIKANGFPLSRSDFDLLARLVTAEADSESYKTKVAVAAVVLNRLGSPLFPKNIPAVINHIDEVGAYQFTPVLNGWINRPANDEARKAVLDALNGHDPTGGALYFFESWVTNPFLCSRPVSKILDSFTFAF